MLTATLQKHIKQCLASCPGFVRELMESLHVDDLSYGGNSIEERFTFYEKSKFHLKMVVLILENLNLMEKFEKLIYEKYSKIRIENKD